MIGRPIASEEFAEILLAEVARVVEYDVEDDFHIAGVDLVDESLERDIVALVAMVDFREIEGVIAVIVVARGIFDYGSDPYSSETESFDIVEFFDEAFEVATPSRVALVSLLIVPTLSVVGRVAIVESGSHDEIDGFVAKVGAIANEGGGKRVEGEK